MTRAKVWLAVLTAGLLSSTGTTGGAGQVAPSDPPRFRIAVDVVRLDAVVTDKDGKLVTDLTADDFDVHQDGRPQKISLVRWIPIAGPQTTVAAPSPSPSAGAAPPARLAPGEVQRTIMIVVDDLGTSIESLPPTRAALHSLVDEQLGPNDLVAVVRTSTPGNALQQFTSDHKVLHAAIDALAWNWQSRNGVEALAPYGQSAGISIGGQLFTAPGFAGLEDLRSSMSATNTFSSLATLIRSTKDLPGRKAMIFVSEGMRMVDRYDGPGAENGQGVLPDIRIVMPRDHVEDQAVRAGVVIYALDPRSLQSGRLRADDDLSKASPETVVSDGADRHQLLMDTQDSLGHLSEQTGGFAVMNTNDLARGLKRITDDQRGYYLIGYVPDAGTFAMPGKTVRYHKLSVEVKRRGLKVRTHTGFLGMSDDDKRTAPSVGGDLLVAALSPFDSGGIPVSLTTRPSDSSGKLGIVGHVRAESIGEDGADVLGLVIDANGTIVSSGTSSTESGPQQIEASLYVPKPGTYQVRFAVRDRRTSAVGSDTTLVTVPDRVHATAGTADIVAAQ
jgi:VWFA-related protein